MTPGQKQEILVVVADGDRFVDAIEQWRQSAVITQLLPPRLALFLWHGGPADSSAPDGPASDSAAPDSLPEDIPGTHWYSDDVPADVLHTLTRSERLFVAAWQDRQTPKVRPGDGLSWDAPGFQPPDRPRHPGPDSDR